MSGEKKDNPAELEPLSNGQILRYGRHLILPAVGIGAQTRIANGSALVVGAGGLGAPVLQYLAGSGVGRIGIVDADVVDTSNLHRQVIHSEERVGQPKTESAAASCRAINSTVRVDTFNERLTAENAVRLVKDYDIVVDCTDNVASRYLINDVAVMCGKPNVSAAAVGTDGMLSIYNYKGGPCYRCIHPKPPPPATVSNCSDNGVLGVVPGILGSLQALEALKVLGGFGEPLSGKLLIFDALACSFRTMRLRPRMPSCALCGDAPSIPNVVASPSASLPNYEEFCGAAACASAAGGSADESCPSVSVEEYDKVVKSGEEHLLIDVREPVQYNICSFPHAKNISLATIKDETRDESSTQQFITRLGSSIASSTSPAPVYVICRRGIDSVAAAKHLLSLEHAALPRVVNVRGGYTQWSRTVDPSFPVY